MCVCVCACVRACVCACVRACVCMGGWVYACASACVCIITVLAVMTLNGSLPHVLVPIRPLILISYNNHITQTQCMWPILTRMWRDSFPEDPVRTVTNCIAASSPTISDCSATNRVHGYWTYLRCLCSHLANKIYSIIHLLAYPCKVKKTQSSTYRKKRWIPLKLKVSGIMVTVMDLWCCYGL